MSRPKIGPKGGKMGPKWGFRRFSQLCTIRNRWFCIFKFISIVLSYCCNKIGWKKFWALKFWAFRPKLGPKWGFRQFSQLCFIRNRWFCIFKFISIVLSYCCNKIGWKIFWALKIWAFRPKLGPKWGFLQFSQLCYIRNSWFCIFKLISLVFNY